MTKKKNTSKSKKEIPFEDALDQLKEIVSQLENGKLTLSESLEKYEQGVKNLNRCYQALEQAQKKIELLVDLDEEGNLITSPFDDTATTHPTPKTTRRAVVDGSGDEADGDSSENDDDLDELSDGEEFEDMDDPNSLF